MESKIAKALSIRDSLQFCETLAKILAITFGPRGQLALIVGETNSAVMTMNGKTILQSINVKNSAVSDVIIETINGHHFLIGDGSKCFVLMLNSMLKEISSALETRMHIMKDLSDFTTILPIVFKEMQSSEACVKAFNATDLQWVDLIRYTIKTYFGNKFGKIVSSALVNALFEFVTKSLKYDNYQSEITFLINHFKLLCTNIGKLTAKESRLIEGLVFNRTFHVYPTSLRNLKEIKFVFIELSEMPNFKITHGASGTNNFIHSSISALTIKRILDLNIKLILINAAPTDSFISICKENQIGLLCTISPSEKDVILKTSNIYPIENFCGNITEKNIGVFDFVKLISFGPNQFINIGILSETIKYHHLFICGPSVAISKQYLEDCLNCLKVLKCLNSKALLNGCEIDSPNEITAFLSGGCWEIELIKLLTRYKKSMCVKWIIKSLLIVPQILHANSNKTALKRYIEAELLLLNSKTPKMINTTTGNVVELNFEVIEPVYAKEYLLYQLITLLISLLKVDFVLAAKKIS